MRRALRSPHVVTLAIGALAGACGSGSSEASTTSNDAAPRDDSSLSPTDASDLDDGDAAPGPDMRGGADGGDAEDAQPNPPECPATDPGFGVKFKPCSVPTSIVCSYPDACDLRPADAGPPFNVYVCHDPGSGGRWTLVDDYTPDCPSSKPGDGDACPCSPHMLYVACLYGTCQGFDRVVYDCQTADDNLTTWKSTPVGCNPPEPDGGLDADGG